MSLSCLVPSPEPTGHCFQDPLQVSNPQKLQYLHRAYAHPVIGWKSTLDGVAHPRQRRCHAPSGHTRLHRKQWQERQVWMCSVQTLLLKHFFFFKLGGQRNRDLLSSTSSLPKHPQKPSQAGPRGNRSRELHPGQGPKCMSHRPLYPRMCVSRIREWGQDSNPDPPKWDADTPSSSFMAGSNSHPNKHNL